MDLGTNGPAYFWKRFRRVKSLLKCVRQGRSRRRTDPVEPDLRVWARNTGTPTSPRYGRPLHEAHFPPQVRRDTTTDRDPLHSELQRAAVSVLCAPFYCARECRFDKVSYWYRQAMVRVTRVAAK